MQQNQDYKFNVVKVEKKESDVIKGDAINYKSEFFSKTNMIHIDARAYRIIEREYSRLKDYNDTGSLLFQQGLQFAMLEKVIKQEKYKIPFNAFLKQVKEDITDIGGQEEFLKAENLKDALKGYMVRLYTKDEQQDLLNHFKMAKPFEGMDEKNVAKSLIEFLEDEFSIKIDLDLDAFLEDVNKNEKIAEQLPKVNIDDLVKEDNIDFGFNKDSLDFKNDFYTKFENAMKKKSSVEKYKNLEMTSEDLGNVAYEMLDSAYTYNKVEKDKLPTSDELRDYLDKKIDGKKEAPKVLNNFYQAIGHKKEQIPEYISTTLSKEARDKAKAIYDRLNEVHAKRSKFFWFWHPNQNKAEKNALNEMKTILQEKFHYNDESVDAYTVDENGGKVIKKATMGDKIAEACAKISGEQFTSEVERKAQETRKRISLENQMKLKADTGERIVSDIVIKRMGVNKNNGDPQLKGKN